MASLLTIAEVAERTGLSAHTLRYYERAGLIAPVARAPGGQRRYAASDMEWIGFLLRLRDTRMPIGQMQAFARLRSEGNATAAERRAMLEQHLAQVLATVNAMQQAAQALQAKIGHYRGLEASLRNTPTPTPTPPRQGEDPHVPRDQSTLPAGPRQAARDRRASR
ncbi:MerR family transcriptional regulator [Pseudorhodoferax sp. Leaf274]|uniref:MerR family transcriptional regulator n=1 Tax=Pseudorhodoferax sp. Leaf274 TaxID=1736318 RepID=UPI00070240BB|nr:MerR family transcriptional regulator [Pseudorhodoferax sp. Leaf274]KQP49871.1 MerR family transcriptional regulator [Pseudorhodoferax sp. Leaf274]